MSTLLIGVTVAYKYDSCSEIQRISKRTSERSELMILGIFQFQNEHCGTSE